MSDAGKVQRRRGGDLIGVATHNAKPGDLVSIGYGGMVIQMIAAEDIPIGCHLEIVTDTPPTCGDKADHDIDGGYVAVCSRVQGHDEMHHCAIDGISHEWTDDYEGRHAMKERETPPVGVAAYDEWRARQERLKVGIRDAETQMIGGFGITDEWIATIAGVTEPRVTIVDPCCPHQAAEGGNAHDAWCPEWVEPVGEMFHHRNAAGFICQEPREALGCPSCQTDAVAYCRACAECAACGYSPMEQRESRRHPVISSILTKLCEDFLRSERLKPKEEE